MKFETILIIFIVLIEIWYWFFKFPRLWKEEATSEIKDMKYALRCWRAYINR